MNISYIVILSYQNKDKTLVDKTITPEIHEYMACMGEKCGSENILFFQNQSIVSKPSNTRMSFKNHDDLSTFLILYNEHKKLGMDYALRTIKS